VKDAINHMTREKATGLDNILINTTKDGNNVINKELIILSMPKEEVSLTTK